jgi:putative Holliday junction resolvase
VRILGIDLGTVRIGFAVSDPLKMFATSIEEYKRKTLTRDIEHILELINEYEVDTIVLGYPLNMDGTKGPKCIETENFANELSQKTSIKIEYQDERLTTVSAQKMLIDSGCKLNKRRNVVDKVSASIILQAYLDRRK